MFLSALWILGSVQAPSVSPGDRFVAFPSTPEMIDAEGARTDPVRIMFHELVFGEKTKENRWVFLLDGKTRVSTAAKNPFTAGGLRPLVETSVLARLRRRYVGRVWAYGELRAVREILNPRDSGSWNVPPGQSLTIERIDQIARVPMDFSRDYALHAFDYTEGKLESKDFGADDPFLVVYRLQNAKALLPDDDEGTLGWSKEQKLRARKTRSYSAPYNVLLGAWQFERMFSSTPPSLSIREALRRCAARQDRGIEDPYAGMSRLELAWQFGWPMERTSLSHTLRRDRWNYGTDYLFGFKNGRVSWYGRSMMH